MIVLDDDASTATSPKSPTGPANATATPSPPDEAPPPAYSAATGSTAVNASPYPYLLAADAERQRRFPPGENAKRRFFKAVGVALVVWLLLALLIESIEVSIQPRKRKLRIEVPKPRKPTDRINYPACVSGSSPSSSTSARTSTVGYPGPYPSGIPRMPNTAFTTLRFSLPVDADRLSFHSNVSHTSGAFNIDPKSRPPDERESETAEDDSIDVDVDLRSFSQTGLRTTQVCLSYHDGNWAIWIIPDSIAPPGTYLQYDIRVQVPARKNTDSPPVYINALSTDLPLAPHNIGTLSEHVRFGDLNLKSSNARIAASSIAAERATVHTSNAPIVGLYSISESIEFSTNNAMLNVDVRLENSNVSKGSGNKQSISMSTENGPIQGTVYLPPQFTFPSDRFISDPAANGQISKPPAIVIDAATANGGLSLIVSPAEPESSGASPDSVRPGRKPAPLSAPAPALRIHARTTNGPVSVAPGDLFVGEFRLEAHGYGSCAWVDGEGIDLRGAAAVPDWAFEGEDVNVDVDVRDAHADADATMVAADGERRLHRTVDVREESQSTECVPGRCGRGRGRGDRDRGRGRGSPGERGRGRGRGSMGERGARMMSGRAGPRGALQVTDSASDAVGVKADLDSNAPAMTATTNRRRRGLSRIVDVREESASPPACGPIRRGISSSVSEGGARVEGRASWARLYDDENEDDDDDYEDAEDVSGEIAHEGWVRMETSNAHAVIKL